MARNLIPAFAYMRTSSAANVGPDKDSETRQRLSIASYAKAAGYKIEDSFHDPAVSGTDPIDQRPGFAALLKRIAGNGVRTIIVESPDRFARDLTVQLTGHALLKERGIALIPTTAPDFFTEDTPTAVMVRQVLGAIAQFEKASLVLKLAGARKRMRQENGKCEGRKGLAITAPEAVASVHRLRRAKPKGGRMSLRAIGLELASMGFLNERGAPFNPKTVASMLRQKAAS